MNLSNGKWQDHWPRSCNRLLHSPTTLFNSSFNFKPPKKKLWNFFFLWCLQEDKQYKPKLQRNKKRKKINKLFLYITLNLLNVQLNMRATTVDHMPRDAWVGCWVLCCIKSYCLVTIDRTPQDACFYCRPIRLGKHEWCVGCSAALNHITLLL